MYPLFEGKYRWTLRRNLTSGSQQYPKQQIERAAVEVWAKRPLAVRLFIGHFAEIQFNAQLYVFPISEWPIARLTEELVRLKELSYLLCQLRLYLGLGATANTLGVRSAAGAGVALPQTLFRASGAVGLGITIASGVALTIAVTRCNNTAQEIEDEIENRRIPNGEIPQEAWDGIEHRVLDRQN